LVGSAVSEIGTEGLLDDETAEPAFSSARPAFAIFSAASANTPGGSAR